MSDPLEFSRPLVLSSVPPEGKALVLVASPAECAALALRYGIPAVGSVKAELTLRLEADGPIRVTGRLRAAVTQTCVVSLEPVDEKVDAAVDLRLLPEGREPQDGPEDPDEIEADRGAVDLGEVIAEQLALALDPYPRAPDAELPSEAQDPPDTPFGKLLALKPQKH